MKDGRRLKRIPKLSLFIIITPLLIWLLTVAFQTKEPITKEQAIKLAEQFIVDNGYTNLPADKSKISYELFDQFEKSVDSIASRRHNTIQVKAFCISEDNDRWHIGFLSTGVDLTKLDSIQRKKNLPGRAVIVMKDGKEISIAHKDPMFSHFEKL